MTIVAILLIAIAASTMIVHAQENIPNLVGHWHGKSMMHFENRGFGQGEQMSKLVIKKQEGRVFHGTKIWVSNDMEMHENFSGVIGIHNKKFYAAGHVDGLIMGDILAENKIVAYYVEDGENAKVIMIEFNKAQQ
ncbi:MAG: hypothetical protein ACLFQV_09305 [Vulcanimicrobiota bacterium]